MDGSIKVLSDASSIFSGLFLRRIKAAAANIEPCELPVIYLEKRSEALRSPILLRRKPWARLARPSMSSSEDNESWAE